MLFCPLERAHSSAVEQRPFKPCVVGSIPTGPSKAIAFTDYHFCDIFVFMTASYGEQCPSTPEPIPQVASQLGRIGNSGAIEVLLGDCVVEPDGSLTLPTTATERILGALGTGSNETFYICPMQPQEDSSAVESEIYRFLDGRFEVDSNRRSLFIDGEEIGLTPKEFALLEVLAGNAGIVLTKHQIADAVWDYDRYAESNSNNIEVYVGYIRRKLGPYSQMLRTKRGIGYMLDDTFDPDTKPKSALQA